MNYIGVLQERCAKAKASLPLYSDLGALPDNTFKYICSLDKWSTEGIGHLKKTAKQKAAKLMLEMIDCEDLGLLGSRYNKEKSRFMDSDAVSQLMFICENQKLNKPLFSDKPDEDGLFVVECTFINAFKAVGRGTNKKIAKEMSADLILKNFFVYFSSGIRTKNNPISQVYEICQKQKWPVEFREEHFITDNEGSYQVTCTVGEFECKSLKYKSKREAKINSAELMLRLLNPITPPSSPKQ